MARGRPALWSAILATPYLLLGLYLFGVVLGPLRLDSATLPKSVRPQLALASLAFGGFAVAVGLYLRGQAAVDPPPMRDDETLLETRHPSQRVARALLVASIPPLAGAIYLLAGTGVPYVYPTLAFLAGLGLYAKGANTYWQNTVTTWYLTDRRMIGEYRFLSLARQELPLEKVRSVEERRSVLENLVGLGHVRAASGGGSLAVTARNIEAPGTFAAAVREHV